MRDMVEHARVAHAVELDEEDLMRERDRVYAPLEDREGVSSVDLEERLQKIMDEYAGGISHDYGTSEGELRIARLHLERLEHELAALRAEDPHELLLCHDVIDRVTVSRVLVEHMSYRKETRWHCYQERLDFPERDDARWTVFVNSHRAKDGTVKVVERPVVRVDVPVVLPELTDGVGAMRGPST
jgi:adenylylsulfate reductase subunit A